MSTEKPMPTRRSFLAQSAFGIGSFALAHLLQQERLRANPVSKPGENLPLNLHARPPHSAPRANAMMATLTNGSAPSGYIPHDAAYAPPIVEIPLRLWRNVVGLADCDIELAIRPELKDTPIVVAP